MPRLAMSITRLALLAALLAGTESALPAEKPAPAKTTAPAKAPVPAAKPASPTQTKPATPPSPSAKAPVPSQAKTSPVLAKAPAPALPKIPQTEADFVAVLKNPAASLKDRQDACRMLQRIGTKASVPTLAALLPDEKLAHLARYALESIPDPTVDYYFRVALSTLKGRPLLGVISSIGVRRDVNAVEPLIALLKNPEPELAQAAARSLGAIGNAVAARALDDAWMTGPAENRPAVADGLLRAAETLFAARQRDPALAIYTKLSLPDAPEQIRAAAVRGVILANLDPATALASELLRSNDIRKVSPALRAGMDLPQNWAVVGALTQAAGPALGDRKILILQALGQTHDPEGLPPLREAAKSPDLQVRIAAVRAMAEIGNPGAVPVLSGFLGDPGVGPAALESLAALPGSEADSAALKLFKSPDKAQRKKGMELIARRRMTGQLPDLVKATADADPEIRLTALQQAAELGGAAQLPALLDALSSASAADLQSVEQALDTVVAKMSEGDAVAQLSARFAKAQPAQKSALVRIAATLGGPQALAAIRNALADSDKGVRETAIRALGAWKTLDAGPVLLGSLKKTSDPAERMLVLRSFASLATRGGDKESQARVASCQDALKTLAKVEEKKVIIGALGGIPAQESVAALALCLDDATLRAEAASALLNVSDRLISSRKTPVQVVRQLVEPLQKTAKVAGGKSADRAAALAKQAQAAQ